MGLGVALEPAIDSLLSAFKPVEAKLPELLGKLEPIIAPLLTRVGELLPTIMEHVSVFFDLLQPIFNLLTGEAMGSIINSVITISTAFMQQLKPAIDVVSWVLGLFLKAVSVVLEVISSIYKLYGNFVGNTWKAVKGIFGGKDDKPGIAEAGKAGAVQNNVVLAKQTVMQATTISSNVGAAANATSRSSVSTPTSFASPDHPNTGQITGGGQKVVRISFRSVVEKMYNTVADTTGLVNTIEPRLDEAINRILAGVS